MNTKWNLIDVILVVVYMNLVHCEIELEITKGKIKGKILKSRDGRLYYSYTGIPYAKPPIGDLRFKAPKPAERWNGILDATKESNICIQQGFINGHEDCLYLNVYSPKTDKKLLPVMFWIHGGGFTWGNSRSGLYGPDYLMDKDVVLVSINYRLGMLGFLSTEDDVLPGNYGMKDQVMSLRWVQENIMTFNGDPDRVTVFGGSSGSASAGYHMLSPMSKGLFHKAILQSGSPVCKWGANAAGVSRKRAHATATIAGCNYNVSEDIGNCLRKLPASHLMGLHTKLFSWFNQPFVLFTPVVENCSSNQEAFLCHHPIYDFKQESFVPAIVGLNSAEGGLFVAPLYNETALVRTEFRTYFNRIFFIMSSYNNYIKPENIDGIGANILERYFPSGEIDDDSHLNAVKLFTDSCFSHCVLDYVRRLSSPVYSYFYDYKNEFSYNTVFGPCKKYLGVAHGDELNSLFKMDLLNPNDLKKEDLAVSKLVLSIWYQFVSSDNYNINGLENGFVWPKFNQVDQLMLYLNSSTPSLIKNPFVNDYNFWSNLPLQ